MSTRLLSFGGSLGIKCVSINNPPFQVRSTTIDENLNEPLYYPFVVSINNWGGNCNTINDLYAQICVQNKGENV